MRLCAQRRQSPFPADRAYFQHCVKHPILERCSACQRERGRCRQAQAKGYQIDYDDWHANVHGVLPYDRCLAQDERLWAIIKVPRARFNNVRHGSCCVCPTGDSTACGSRISKWRPADVCLMQLHPLGHLGCANACSSAAKMLASEQRCGFVAATAVSAYSATVSQQPNRQRVYSACSVGNARAKVCVHQRRQDARAAVP